MHRRGDSGRHAFLLGVGLWQHLRTRLNTVSCSATDPRAATAESEDVLQCITEALQHRWLSTPRWRHHDCHPACRMSRSARWPSWEGTFAKIFKELEEEIVKDLVVKKLDQFLYNYLGVDLSFHVSEGLRCRGEEVLEVLNVRT